MSSEIWSENCLAARWCHCMHEAVICWVRVPGCAVIFHVCAESRASFLVWLRGTHVLNNSSMCASTQSLGEASARCEDGECGDCSGSLHAEHPTASTMGESSSIVFIISPFSSHLASLFINIRGTCKLEHAEMLSFGQEHFQRAPRCSERVLSSWLHWTVEQAKRC